MKKKILFIATLVGMSMFIGCQRFDFEEAHQEAIRQNAENIFGKIDPNQDWKSRSPRSADPGKACAWPRLPNRSGCGARAAYTGATRLRAKTW